MKYWDEKGTVRFKNEEILLFQPNFHFHTSTLPCSWKKSEIMLSTLIKN